VEAFGSRKIFIICLHLVTSDFTLAITTNFRVGVKRTKINKTC
jgi:hypothetical protein